MALLKVDDPAFPGMQVEDLKEEVEFARSLA